MTREEIIHELGEWLEQMVQHGVPSHSAKRKALATAIVLLSAEAADVYKAHEEEHLEIINRIKELQYAIAKTQTIVGEVVESADAEKTYIGIDIPYGSDKGIATIFKRKDDKLILEEVKELMRSWIPCSERLPEVGETCLLTVHEYGWNCKDYTRVIIGEYSDNYADHILAWMPLPKPYREDGE